MKTTRHCIAIWMLGAMLVAMGFRLGAGILRAAGSDARVATAIAAVEWGVVTGITVTDGGAGYLNTPLTVTIAGGGGTGATAMAVVTNGAVSGIIVMDQGHGYTNVPTVIIDKPQTLYANNLGIWLAPVLRIEGQVGSTNVIEFLDLLEAPKVWQTLTNIVMTSSPMLFVDLSAPPGGQRYYRASGDGLLINNPDPANLVWVPPGRFTMGSPVTEKDRYEDEGPQTVVVISHGFWMGKYEVTQGNYQAVTGTNLSYFSGNLQRPVEQVSWYDATNYCGQLTQQQRAAGRLPAGFCYRLPTEAEWEYACRAGTTTRYYFGDDPGYNALGLYAWYFANSDYITHPVGLKRPNPLGLYDMSGNVWEWCWDWYEDRYPGGILYDRNVDTPGSGRVIRGGSWSPDGGLCRSAYRNSYLPGNRGSNVGFRVVLAPEKMASPLWY